MEEFFEVENADTTSENIIENKKCLSCGVIFAITDKDAQFLEKISPVFA